jgi:ABC-type multidrug transport system ATPase subunit
VSCLHEWDPVFLTTCLCLQPLLFKLRTTSAPSLYLSGSLHPIPVQSAMSGMQVQFGIREASVSPTHTVLRNVVIRVPLGQVVTLLGPSGAGKTCLLEVMAGTFQGRAEASAEVIPADGAAMGGASGAEAYIANGAPAGPPIRSARIAFCPQNDEALLPCLTVHQTLTFAAALCARPAHVTASMEVLEANVAQVEEALGLTEIRHQHIGSVFSRSLSGGEKRRVSIGVALLLQPDLLLMDEPTSSLDSHIASHLIADVQRIARKFNIGVVCSLHQPSDLVLQSVDSLVLLAAGSIILQGSLKECHTLMTAATGAESHNNLAERMLDFIQTHSVEQLRHTSESLGMQRRIPPDMLNQRGSLQQADPNGRIRSDSGARLPQSPVAGSRQRSDSPGPGIRPPRSDSPGPSMRSRGDSPMGIRPRSESPSLVPDIISISSPAVTHDGYEVLHDSAPQSSGPPTGAGRPTMLFLGVPRMEQFKLLCWRYWLVIKQDPFVFLVRLVMIELMSIVIGVLYYDLNKDYESINDLLNAL